MRSEIEQLFDQKPGTYTDEHFRLFQRFKLALNAGEIRAAEPDPSAKTGWRVNAWVKKGILLGFRMGGMQVTPVPMKQPSRTLEPPGTMRTPLSAVKVRTG